MTELWRWTPDGWGADTSVPLDEQERICDEVNTQLELCSAYLEEDQLIDWSGQLWARYCMTGSPWRA